MVVIQDVSRRPARAASDERLAELAGDGHEQAFQELVSRYRHALLAYATRILRSETRAEDAVQQSLVSAWLALGRGQEVRNVKAWLYRIVRNQSLNMARDAGEAPTGLEDDALASPGPAEIFEQRLAAREALSHLAQLPAMQREALVQTAVHGRSRDQVAHALGLTSGAVRGLAYRARATVRAAMGALVPSPLLNLLSRAGDRAAPVAGVAGAGGGSAGIAAVLAKGTAATVSAVALAAGVIHIAAPHHVARPGSPAKPVLPRPLSARGAAASVAPASPADLQAGDGTVAPGVPGLSRSRAGAPVAGPSLAGAPAGTGPRPAPGVVRPPAAVRPAAPAQPAAHIRPLAAGAPAGSGVTVSPPTGEHEQRSAAGAPPADSRPAQSTGGSATERSPQPADTQPGDATATHTGGGDSQTGDSHTGGSPAPPSGDSSSGTSDSSGPAAQPDQHGGTSGSGSDGTSSDGGSRSGSTTGDRQGSPTPSGDGSGSGSTS